MGRRGAPLAAALLLSVGCTEVTEVETRGSATVLISAVVAGADSAFVLLGRSEPGRSARPEPGAALELVVGGRTFDLLEGPPGACGPPAGFSCYRTRTAGALAPGEEVALRGALASGAPVLGAAVAPPVPPLSFDGAEGDTVRGVRLGESGPGPALQGLDDIAGRVAAADSLVEATVWADGVARRCPVRLSPPSWYDLRAFGRVSVGVGRPLCGGMAGEPWDSMAVPVTFLAYDAHFTAWAASGPQAHDGGAFGLEGVHGVFGAATARRFVFVVTP